MFAIGRLSSRGHVLLTVAGLGGEPEYDARFSGWAKDLDKLLHEVEPKAKIKTLYGADATRANVEAYLKEVARDSKPDDSLILMLIGHGTQDEFDYKFNLPGPDLTAAQLAGLLDKISAHELIVNMTSASGGSLVVLEKPKRVVITATKSGTEKNATVFPRYWIEGMRDPTSDVDKNDIITALEVFRYAEEKDREVLRDAEEAFDRARADRGRGEGRGCEDSVAREWRGADGGTVRGAASGRGGGGEPRSCEAGAAETERRAGGGDRRFEISQGFDGGAGVSHAATAIAAESGEDAGGA